MAKNWVGAVPFFWEAGSPSNTIALAEAYLRTKWYRDTYSRMATIDKGRKLGAVPFWRGRGGVGSHLTQCRLGQGLPFYQLES